MTRTPLIRELLIELYHDRGMSQWSIGIKTGWSASCVGQTMRRMGIPTRDPKRRWKRP